LENNKRKNSSGRRNSLSGEIVSGLSDAYSNLSAYSANLSVDRIKKSGSPQGKPLLAKILSQRSFTFM
jgi:hypothetical protein